MWAWCRGHLNAVTGDGSGQLWIAGEEGLLLHSVDHGTSWQSLDSPYNGSWFGISRDAASARIVVFGLRGHVFASDDDGASWEPVHMDKQAKTVAGGGFVGNRCAVLAGAGGTLLVSRDGGQYFESRYVDGRLGLSAATLAGGHIIAVGRGGVHRSGQIGELP